MALSVPQRQIIGSTSRFTVAVCGRRFGKSFVGAYAALREAGRGSRKLVWYVAPTYSQTEEVWLIILNEAYRLNWIRKANESKKELTLKNGSRIRMKSADNPESLRGAGLDYLILDEFADIKPAAYYEVMLPMLADKKGGNLLIGTPKGVGNWSYDVYQRGLEHPDWANFHYTTAEGGWVSDDELEMQRSLLDARTYKQEFEADFVTSSNRIWYGFDINENVQVYEKSMPRQLYIGMDFNVDPMSATIFSREEWGTHLIDEIEIFGSNTDEMVEEIQNRYPKSHVYVYPDPSGKKRQTSSGNRSDHRILQNAGFVVRAKNVTRSVRDGINAVNSMLCNTNNERRLLVDPKCRRSIECLNKHSYKAGSSIPDKDTGYDHLSDAIRYYIDYEYPIKKEVKTTTPQRWGHAIG